MPRDTACIGCFRVYDESDLSDGYCAACEWGLDDGLDDEETD